jgi:hypothetical protein
MKGKHSQDSFVLASWHRSGCIGPGRELFDYSLEASARRILIRCALIECYGVAAAEGRLRDAQIGFGQEELWQSVKTHQIK